MYMHGGSSHAGEPGLVLYVEVRVLWYTATGRSEWVIIINSYEIMVKKIDDQKFHEIEAS